jgi:hypothetical protein
MADVNGGQHYGRSHNFFRYKSLRHLAKQLEQTIPSFPEERAITGGRQVTSNLTPCISFFPKQLQEFPLLAQG